MLPGRHIPILSVALFMLFGPFSLLAQAQSCQQELSEANNLYARGRFDETIALLDRCLEKDNVSSSDRRTAYRLKGLSFIGKGLEVDAQTSVRRLLQLVPNYEPDPVQDPPDFIEMVNEIKQEINETIARGDQDPAAAVEEEQADEEVQAPPPAGVDTPVENQEEPKKKRGGAGKWILGGLGVAAVGGAVILLSGGGNGGGDAISEPPPLPQ